MMKKSENIDDVIKAEAQAEGREAEKLNKRTKITLSITLKMLNELNSCASERGYASCHQLIYEILGNWYSARLYSKDEI